MAANYDVIVIGEGVAGLTAAGELAGAGLKVATLEAQLFGGLVININEGRQYRVGEISFTGNKLFNSALLKRVVRQKTGVVFVPSKLDKDVERLDDFYGKDGYLDTRVRLNRKPNVATGAIDVEYTITEGEKFNVESIVIEGNTKTKSTVILRELVLGPGDVFSTVLMKISQLRLENTRFFESVNVNHQETNKIGRAHV